MGAGTGRRRPIVTPSRQRVAAAGGGATLLGLLVALVSPALGSATVVAGVVVLAAAMPSWGLWLILLAFPLHPLLMKVAEVDLGVTGWPLVLLSAWKEACLAAVVLAAGLPWLRASGLRRSTFAHLDLVAALLVVLTSLGLLAAHSALALSAARLLVFPVGVYVGVRLGLLAPVAYARAAVVEAGFLGLFGVIQSSLLGWGFVQRYHGQPGLPIPPTFTAQLLDGPRASSTYGSPNEFGLAMVIYGSIATALILVGRRRDLRWLVPVSTLIWLGLAASFSRSAILAGIVAVAAIAAFRLAMLARERRESLGRLAAMALPAVLVTSLLFVDRGGFALLGNTLRTLVSAPDTGPAASAIAGLPTPTGPLFASPSSSAPGPTTARTPPPEPSTGGHLSSLAAGTHLMIAHPLGIGLGNIGSRQLPLSSEKPDYIVESWYLMMALSLGWLGLAWSLWFLTALGWTAIRAFGRSRASPIPLALVGLVPGIAVVSFFLPTLFEPQLAMVPWALGAASLPALIASPPSRTTMEAMHTTQGDRT